LAEQYDWCKRRREVMKTEVQVIPPEGEITVHELDWPKEPSYEQLCEVMKLANIPRGYLEHVNVWLKDEKRYTDMIVHESGRLEGHPHNPRASELYWANAEAHQNATREEMKAQGYDIVGTALLFNRRVVY
jgi:hypothetical protein